jgi:hypothetical protein
MVLGLMAAPPLLWAQLAAVPAKPVPAMAASARAAPAAPAPVASATTPTFLALSDIHLAARSGLRCGRKKDAEETSPALWQAAQARAQSLIQTANPAFVIYLGDLPAHCGGSYRQEFTAALDGLANIVGSSTKLIYLPGNSDSLGGDYGPFTYDKQTPLDLSKIWIGGPVLNAQASDMIDSSRLAQGYYSVYAVQNTATAPALRVLALNTNMFTATYDGIPGSTYQADTNAQLEWIDAQLQDARTKSEKVIIAMHVPPGIDGYVGQDGGITTMWNRRLYYTGKLLSPKPEWVQATFLRIVANYGPEIVGLLSSHTHFNEIRRLRDCSQPYPRAREFYRTRHRHPGDHHRSWQQPGDEVVQLRQPVRMDRKHDLVRVGQHWRRLG